MIGVFDSGVGGLTVLHALRKRMPKTDVVYFGDTANAPYGIKSPGKLFDLSVSALSLLKKHGARNIVIACNSASSILSEAFLDAAAFSAGQVVGMIQPTVDALKGSHARIALCATPATVNSQSYQSAFQKAGKEIVAISIPDLGASIEAGGSDTELEKIIRRSIPEPNFDLLILGNTHYPLAANIFRNVLPLSVTLFNPAEPVAERTARLFGNEEQGGGAIHFLISKDTSNFHSLVQKLFPGDASTITVVG